MTKFYPQAVEVTPEMSYRTRHALKANGFQCIVAPFEADGQLAAGCRLGHWWAVISEDSDILVLGAPRVITKYRSGHGEMYSYAKIAHDITGPGSLIEKSIPHQMTLPAQAAHAWTSPHKESATIHPAYFIAGCILGGCDYVANVPGIGLKRAFGFLRDAKGSMKQTMRLMRLEGYSIPEGYGTRFALALVGFYCQLAIHPGTNEPIFMIARGDWTESTHQQAFARWHQIEGQTGSVSPLSLLRAILLPHVASNDENLLSDILIDPALKPSSHWQTLLAECFELTDLTLEAFLEAVLDEFGLSSKQATPSDLCIGPEHWKKLKAFCIDGDLHPVTLRPFPSVDAPEFLDHPIILSTQGLGRAVGAKAIDPSTPQGQQTLSTGNTLTNGFTQGPHNNRGSKFSKAGHLNRAKGPGPPATPAGATLTDYFRKQRTSNEVVLSVEKTGLSPRRGPIEPLTEVTLTLHKKRYAHISSDRRILRHLHLCQKDPGESKIQPDYSNLINSLSKSTKTRMAIPTAPISITSLPNTQSIPPSNDQPIHGVGARGHHTPSALATPGPQAISPRIVMEEMHLTVGPSISGGGVRAVNEDWLVRRTPRGLDSIARKAQALHDDPQRKVVSPYSDGPSLLLANTGRDASNAFCFPVERSERGHQEEGIMTQTPRPSSLDPTAASQSRQLITTAVPSSNLDVFYHPNNREEDSLYREPGSESPMTPSPSPQKHQSLRPSPPPHHQLFTVNSPPIGYPRTSVPTSDPPKKRRRLLPSVQLQVSTEQNGLADTSPGILSSSVNAMFYGNVETAPKRHLGLFKESRNAVPHRNRRENPFQSFFAASSEERPSQPRPISTEARKRLKRNRSPRR